MAMHAVAAITVAMYTSSPVFTKKLAGIACPYLRPCTLILLKTWHYISHLLTYLLTYLK